MLDEVVDGVAHAFAGIVPDLSVSKDFVRSTIEFLEWSLDELWAQRALNG